MMNKFPNAAVAVLLFVPLMLGMYLSFSARGELQDLLRASQARERAAIARTENLVRDARQALREHTAHSDEDREALLRRLATLVGRPFPDPDGDTVHHHHHHHHSHRGKAERCTPASPLAPLEPVSLIRLGPQA